MWDGCSAAAQRAQPASPHGDAMFKVPRAVFLLLILHPFAIGGGSSSGQIRAASISPDGKLIAVDFGKGSTSFIYTIGVETGTATRLTDAKIGAESAPAFSPDGKRIAYSYWPGTGERSSIVIVNVDSSDLHSWSSESSDYWPVFSPDNKTIIFARSGYYGSYSPIAQPHPHAWNFYASDPDGTNVRQLTKEKFYMASPPSVSPDCKSFVTVTEGLDAPQQIAVYSLDHPEKPSLSLRPHVPGEPKLGQVFDFPNYMPDGKSILFMAASEGKLPWSSFDYDIYRVDIGTGTVERLTKGNGYATDLKVSSNGKTAVFLKWRSDWHATPNKSELYLLDLQTHKITPLKVTGLD
jgi:WD40-like Beta Propeller Repeat